MTGPTKPKVLLAEMVPRGNDVRKLTPHMGLNKKQKKIQIYDTSVFERHYQNIGQA